VHFITNVFISMYYIYAIGGLQDIRKCTFDSPVFCNYDLNGTENSGYVWKRISGNDLYPMPDGDTNVKGMISYKVFY